MRKVESMFLCQVAQSRLACRTVLGGAIAAGLVSLSPQLFAAERAATEHAQFLAARQQDYWHLELNVPDHLLRALPELSPAQIRTEFAAIKKTVQQETGVEIIYDFPHLPLMMVRRPDPQTQLRASARAGVHQLRPPPQVRRSASATATSSQLGANVMRNLGYDGRGVSVLITDGSIDVGAIHQDLGSCTSVGQPALTCNLASYHDLSSGDDTSAHGTNVSSIIALTAPGVRIHHYDVSCGGVCISSSAAFEALDWALEHREELNIVAHNMSWGGPDAGCAQFSSVLAAASAAGIAQIAAAGNDGTSQIQWPACQSGVFSVGALSTTAGDALLPPELWTLTSFTDAEDGLNFATPGVGIEAGGYEMTGTSMAAPHLTGVIAILQAPGQWNGLSTSSLNTLMTRVGVPVADARLADPVIAPDVYRSRRARLDIDNPLGVVYGIAPAPIRSCGSDCYEFPAQEVTLTLPTGYTASGCRRVDATHCALQMDRSRAPRIYNLASMVVTLSRPGFLIDPEVFADGFEAASD